MAQIAERNAQKVRPLSPLQQGFVDAFIECDGMLPCVAEKTGRTYNQVYDTYQSANVRNYIDQLTKRKLKSITERRAQVFEKEDRLELLWKVANDGARLIYDKEGNEVMANPQVTVSSIRTMNDMIAGSLAPKEVEVTHKVDNRSEAEIMASIQELTAQVQQLNAQALEAPEPVIVDAEVVECSDEYQALASCEDKLGS